MVRVSSQPSHSSAANRAKTAGAKSPSKCVEGRLIYEWGKVVHVPVIALEYPSGLVLQGKESPCRISSAWIPGVVAIDFENFDGSFKHPPHCRRVEICFSLVRQTTSWKVSISRSPMPLSRCRARFLSNTTVQSKILLPSTKPHATIAFLQNFVEFRLLSILITYIKRVHRGIQLLSGPSRSSSCSRRKDEVHVSSVSAQYQYIRAVLKLYFASGKHVSSIVYARTHPKRYSVEYDTVCVRPSERCKQCLQLVRE